MVSIFVNPLQFGAGEDFARYPRPLADDLAACEAEGVDIVFAPEAADLYAADRQVTVSAGLLGQVLEGAAPGPLRRRADRGPQAVPHRRPGAGRVRAEGRPAAGLHPADGAGSEPGRRGARRADHPRTPTGSPCPAATSTSARPSAPWPATCRSPWTRQAPSPPSERPAPRRTRSWTVRPTIRRSPWTTPPWCTRARSPRCPTTTAGPRSSWSPARVGRTRLIDNATVSFG